MSKTHTPTVLIIAGFDPYGGAGIQVDCKVIHALDAHAFSVTTSLTAQNSQGVKFVQNNSCETVKIQLETLLNDLKVDAVKIGMLGNAETVNTVVEIIDKYELKNIVLDPVLVSSSGKVLLEEKAIGIMQKELFPRVDLITPNLPEINRFLNTSFMGKESEIEEIAKLFFQKNVKNILIKGGHSSEVNAVDYLVDKTLNICKFSTPRVETLHTHGTGCILSSAIAAGLAKGLILSSSTKEAKVFLYEKLQLSSTLNFNYIDKTLKRKESIL
jgi:hydroxymethylpyrimidine/phosphomethylpyrimidine kinase